MISNNETLEKAILMLSRLRFKKEIQSRRTIYERSYGHIKVRVVIPVSDPLTISFFNGKKQIFKKRLIRVKSLNRNISKTIGDVLRNHATA